MAFSASQRPAGVSCAHSASKRGDRVIKQRVASFVPRINSPAFVNPLHLVPSNRTSTRAMVSQLVNSPEELVQQSLDGLLMASPHLARLDGFPDIKVVFNKNLDKKKVAIISGGGSGHEPGHTGYVGDGMLTAAVAGEVFASPSAEAVLAAIRTVTGDAGCVLIIKNYTGDRLHFGLAAEQAKAEGYKVEMVVVGEDVAIDSPGIAGRRGLAGTALVHKIAGATAASGASLEEVAKAAHTAAESMATLGVATRVCSMPGKETSDRIKEHEVEIGLGIHGEPGFEKVKAMPAQAMTERMMKQLTSSAFFDLQSGERVVLLINNLGGSTPLEMTCMMREAITYLQDKSKVTVERCYTGHFMTSLDAQGCSLTLLRIPSGKEGDALLAALDSPVGAAGWPHTNATVAKPNVVPVPKGKDGSLDAATERPKSLSPEGANLERVILAVTDKLIKEAQGLNDLDAKVGDGDCGDTLLHGAEAIQADCKASYPLNDTAATLGSVARSVRKAVGGTSGALYDVALTSAAASLRDCGSKEIGPAQWAAALKAGVQAVEKYGGAKPGSRTMLDALLPAAEALEEAASQGKKGVDAAGALADAAEQGGKDTANMTASAGRASYVPQDVQKSNPDPGAIAVGIWMRTIAETIKSNSLVKA